MASIMFRTAKKVITNPNRQLAQYFCSKSNDKTTSSSSEKEISERAHLEAEPDNYLYFDKSGDKVWRTRAKLSLPKSKAKDPGYTGVAFSFVDPRSDSPEIVGEHTRDIVQAKKDIMKKEQGYYGPYYRAASDYLKARTSPTIIHCDDAGGRFVSFMERLKSEVYLGNKMDDGAAAHEKNKSGEQQAEVSDKSLQGWYPIIYRALSRYIKVGNLVIIHIDYDYALDVLLYLMADESDMNDDLRKKKLSLEQQEKLSKILRDIESKSKGMPLAKKMDLLLVAVMLFTQQEYPEIHKGIGIMDQILAFFRGTKPAQKEISTLLSCEKGLLVLLEAPGFKSADRLKVHVENDWLIVKGGGETTAGYKEYDERVEIPCDHAYDQEGVVAELSDGEIKVLFPFASEDAGRIDHSFNVEWGKVDI